MLALRYAAERGQTKTNRLDSRHTFSFGRYHDPAHMGFRGLRVINEDIVAATGGFPTHGHQDMEIITYVISGTLRHRDNMGHERTLSAGQVQAMSAGSGVEHSEYNASDTESAHFLQIWIVPHTRGVTPGYAEWSPPAEGKNIWHQAVSGDAADGSLKIHQDARMWLAHAEAGTTMNNPVTTGRYGWLQVAKGSVSVADRILHAGDGMSFNAEDWRSLHCDAQATLLCFDLS